MPLLKMNRGAQRALEGQFDATVADTMRNSAGNVVSLNTSGTTAYDIIALPTGAVVLGGMLVVDTAFNTTGTATISLGDSGSATRYLGATNLKSAATTALTGVGVKNAAGLPLRATIALADAAATAGAFRIMVRYLIDGRVEEIARSYPAQSL